MKRKTKAAETTKTQKEISKATVDQYLAALDAAIIAPEHVRETAEWGNRYVDLWLSFFLDHPNEATPLLKAVFPKVESLTNADVRTLGQMSAKAFPDASFPYLTFAESGSVSAAVVRNWFTNVVAPAAMLAWMKRQFGKLVYLGIWTHLREQKDLIRTGTLAEEVEGCSRLVWTWAARPEIVSSLMRERVSNPKRVGTRLKSYASNTVARTWKTLSLRAKQKEPIIVAVDDPEQPIKASPRTIGGGSSVEEQKPRTTAMFCVPCESLKPVVSEADGALHLACGHYRGSILPESAPAK